MQLNGVAAVPTEEYTNSALATSATLFAALGDNYVFPNPLPLANVFSLGDALIALGAVVFLVRQQRTVGTERGRGPSVVRPLAG